MLQISHLYKNYGKFQAVRDLNLHVPKGDLFGFVGPNGAGKTTTMKMLLGLTKPCCIRRKSKSRSVMYRISLVCMTI